MTSYLYGIFTIANLCIAFFIAVYAYMFLAKTKKHRERRPWDFLFVSSVLFFLFEVISLLVYFGVGASVVTINMVIVSKIFEFLYSGFVLLAFISQHDLILRSHLILISRKEDEKGIKITIEAKKKEEK